MCKEHDAFQLHRCCILSSLAVPLTREVIKVISSFQSFWLCVMHIYLNKIHRAKL